MNKVVMILGLLMFPLLSICQTEWIEVGKHKDGTTIWLSSKYLSKDRLCEHMDVIRVWTRKVQPSMTIKGVRYKNVQSKVLYAVDINTKQITNINIAIYSYDGNLLVRQQREECQEKWTDAPPDSILESILNKIIELFVGD